MLKKIVLARTGNICGGWRVDCKGLFSPFLSTYSHLLNFSQIIILAVMVESSFLRADLGLGKKRFIILIPKLYEGGSRMGGEWNPPPSLYDIYLCFNI